VAADATAAGAAEIAAATVVAAAAAAAAAAISRSSSFTEARPSVFASAGGSLRRAPQSLAKSNLPALHLAMS
jgi:hypothetical protein